MLHPLLPVFICVADCGSFHKAAERLYLSPPAVMKQINTLERQLELTLFDRSSRGIRLTAAGQVIYRHARVLTDYCSQAMEEARRQAGAAEKVFCIGTSLLNPCKPFMDLWQRVGREFPGIGCTSCPLRTITGAFWPRSRRWGRNTTFWWPRATRRCGCPGAISSAWAAIPSAARSTGTTGWPGGRS